VVGYVAQGDISLSVNGAGARTVAQGRSFYVPAGAATRITARRQAATVVTFRLSK
jgi:hypothetical protein